MGDSSSICLSCGICCDGTLIGFVQLAQEELPRVKKLMDIEEGGGNGFILHPCSKFCDRCTIYDQRPQQCRKFECDLLKSVDDGALAFEKAIELVKEVKAKKHSIEEKLGSAELALQSESFYFKMVELKKTLRKAELEMSITENQLALKAELQDLDVLVSEYFGVSFD